MKFPRFPLLTRLLRKPSRTSPVPSTASIAGTIDKALRDAGLIVDPRPAPSSPAPAATSSEAPGEDLHEAARTLALPGPIDVSLRQDGDSAAIETPVPATRKSRVASMPRARIQRAARLSTAPMSGDT